MDIHHYHPDTGLYLGSSSAEADPLELTIARAAVFDPLHAAAVADRAAALDAGGDPEAVQAAFDLAVQAAQATADAVEPEAWLIPAFATETAPPTCAEGECAVMTADGWIVVADVPAEPTEEPAEIAPDVLARDVRDRLIADARWVIERHRDEIDLARPTTLSPAEYLDVLTYVQALRDIPAQSGFAAEIDWPVPPAALTTTP